MLAVFIRVEPDDLVLFLGCRGKSGNQGRTQGCFFEGPLPTRGVVSRQEYENLGNGAETWPALQGA